MYKYAQFYKDSCMNKGAARYYVFPYYVDLPVAIIKGLISIFLNKISLHITAQALDNLRLNFLIACILER